MNYLTRETQTVLARVLLPLLFLTAVLLVFFLSQAEAETTWSVDWGYLQCSVHGHGDEKSCDHWNLGGPVYMPAGYDQYSTSISLLGHRHGGSGARAEVCLEPLAGGGGQCWAWGPYSGDALGPELGGTHYFFDWASGSLDSGSPTQKCELEWDESSNEYKQVCEYVPQGSYAAGARITFRSWVNDAESRLSGRATAVKKDVPEPEQYPRCRNNSCLMTEDPSGQSCSSDAQCISQSGAFSLSGSCSAEGDKNRASLSWTSSPGAVSYRVERHTWSTGPWESVDTTTETSFSELLRNDEAYYYRVFAIDSNGGETVSNPSELYVCGAVGSNNQPPPQPQPSSCVDNSSMTFVNPLPQRMQPNQTAQYTIKATNIGNTRWYHPIAYGVGEISGARSGYVSPITNWCHSGWVGGAPVCYDIWPQDNMEWTFNYQAPSTPGTYLVKWRMLHAKGADYIKSNKDKCSPPSQDTYFGQTLTATVQVVTSTDSGTSSVKINCSPSSVDYNGSAIVSWTSTNVSSCTISPTGWTGTSDSRSTGALTKTTTYTATCQAEGGGEVSDSCTVSVNPSAYRNVCIIDGACMRVYGSGRNECSDPGNPDSSDCPQPPPSCSSFTATPDRFAYPPAKSVTLSWSCTKAHNGCTITDNNPEAPDIGSVPQSGSVLTPPLTKTTDYVLKCSGRGGTSPEYHLPLGSLRVYQFTGGKLQEVAPGTQP
jgi:hypothetical protein